MVAYGWGGKAENDPGSHPAPSVSAGGLSGATVIDSLDTLYLMELKEQKKQDALEQFGGTGDDDDADILPHGLEVPLGEVGERRGDTTSILDLGCIGDTRLLGNGHGEVAVSELEVQGVDELMTGFGQFIETGYTHVYGTGCYESGDILCTHEHHLEILVGHLHIELPADILAEIQSRLP